MKKVAILFLTHIFICVVLCIFVDLALPSILCNLQWQKCLGFLAVACFLCASLDVSYSKLKSSLESATPRVSYCFFWVYLIVIVIFSVWICYVITCSEELFIMEKYFTIKKVFPSLMLLYSLKIYSVCYKFQRLIKIASFFLS